MRWGGILAESVSARSLVHSVLICCIESIYMFFINSIIHIVSHNVACCFLTSCSKCGAVCGSRFAKVFEVLSDAKARKLKSDDGTMAVGGVTGLYFRPATRAGTGKFILRFVSPANGKRRDMGVGTYPEIGLAETRRLAMTAREAIAKGIDPITERESTRARAIAHPQMPSFEEAAERVHSALAPGYRNAKHSAQWISTMKAYAFPHIGDRQVDTLTTADFADLLAPIWLSKSETAGRVKQRCDRVMVWCLARRFCSTKPVSAVDALLPVQRGKRERVTHHPAVPWRQMPDVLAQTLHPMRATTGRDALLFLILTAARSGEVRGASWDEVDLDRHIWTIPAARMKAEQVHRVPLNTQVCEILERRLQFKNEGPWIFSNTGLKPISDMTLTALLRGAMVGSDTDDRVATAHGFRSSFRDWASENAYARDLAERALAHTITNSTEAAYHRTDQLEGRKPMMQDRGDYVMSKIVY
jgi:integrase